MKHYLGRHFLNYVWVYPLSEFTVGTLENNNIKKRRYFESTNMEASVKQETETNTIKEEADSLPKICRFCYNSYEEDLLKIQEKEIEMMRILCLTLVSIQAISFVLKQAIGVFGSI